MCDLHSLQFAVVCIDEVEQILNMNIKKKSGSTIDPYRTACSNSSTVFKKLFTLFEAYDLMQICRIWTVNM